MTGSGLDPVLASSPAALRRSDPRTGTVAPPDDVVEGGADVIGADVLGADVFGADVVEDGVDVVGTDVDVVVVVEVVAVPRLIDTIAVAVAPASSITV